MSSTRTSSRSLDDEDDSDFDDDEEKDDEDDASKDDGKSKKKKKFADDGEDDEEEEVDFGSRTLGRSCMYGVRGEVIFRPEGSICRGDEATSSRTPRASKNRRDQRAGKPRANSNRRPKDRARPEARSSGRPAAKDPRARPKAAKKKSRGGPCMYDGKGKVIYAPSGATCRDR